MTGIHKSYELQYNVPMTQQTASELLVLGLLALTSSRIFFLKKVKRDVVSTVPLVAFLLSLLNIVAWGLTPFELLISALSLFVTIWNIRAMLRLASKLVIDHYSGLFTIISVINLLLTIALTVLVLAFSPVHASLKKFEVTRTDIVACGSFSQGFTERTNPLERASAKISIFNSNFTPGYKGSIIFIPNKNVSIDNYQPMLVKLAHDGYSVYAAEFSEPNVLWFDQEWKNNAIIRHAAFFYDTQIAPQPSVIQSERTEDFANEYRALLSFVPIQNGRPVYAVADKDDAQALAVLRRDLGKIVRATVDIANVSTYLTKGLGPIEQTDPLTAKIKFNLEKDSTLFTASHLATAIESALSEQ